MLGVTAVHYLLGDSTESGLDFNYLAFLRDVIDVAVALVDSDAALATTDDRKQLEERQAHATIAAIEELGRRATQLVAPLVHAHDTPVGRCANAIAVAARDATERESTQVRSALASALAAIEAENAKLRKRSVEIFDRLLKTHDLPGAEKVYEIAWTGTGIKAAMRQRMATGIETAIEAVLALEVPAGSLFTTDLRVDKLVDGIEINSVEPGGWLKKGDKLVPHKIGRFHITRVVAGADVSVRVRSVGDQQDAFAFELTTDHNGEIRIDRLGGASTARELGIDDEHQPKVRALTDKLAAAARALASHRTSVVSVEVDGTPLANHAQPRVIAERLIAAVAPTVIRIARHSRNPGELVLRRMLGDDRREEIFITTAELQKKIDTLPVPARAVFAPLELDGDAAPAYIPPSPSSATRPRGRTVPPPHPPPPPPKRPHAQKFDTLPLELIELSPDTSSPGMPAAAQETQPTDSTPATARAHRPTQATEPPPIRGAQPTDEPVTKRPPAEIVPDAEEAKPD